MAAEDFSLRPLRKVGSSLATAAGQSSRKGNQESCDYYNSLHEDCHGSFDNSFGNEPAQDQWK